MSSLEVGQVLLMGADGLFQLLDVLGATFSEGRLSLTVPLLPLLRSRIDLPPALAHARKLSCA